jgi:hypothetical protein
MMNKKGLIGAIIIVIVLLIVGFFWFIGNFETTPDPMCGVEDACVKVQATCCPCNMGGEELCVPSSEVEKYEKDLENCSATQLCAAVYNCEIESCGCVDGECVGK